MINRDKFIFIKALMTHPRLTGAICPSSEGVAKAMVSCVMQRDNGLVVELGAGTGVITDALLDTGLKPKNIIIVEYSDLFVEKLLAKFPAVEIIEGNASELSNLLKNDIRTVNTIISSLPLRSLPKALTQKILSEISRVLPVGGRYIQLTYGFMNDNASTLKTQFEKIATKRIWRNLPPARVDVWVKKSH